MLGLREEVLKEALPEVHTLVRTFQGDRTFLVHMGTGAIFGNAS